jgi:hypothetical protein
LEASLGFLLWLQQESKKKRGGEGFRQLPPFQGSKEEPFSGPEGQPHS